MNKQEFYFKERREREKWMIHFVLFFYLLLNLTIFLKIARTKPVDIDLSRQ